MILVQIVDGTTVIGLQTRNRMIEDWVSNNLKYEFKLLTTLQSTLEQLSQEKVAFRQG